MIKILIDIILIFVKFYLIASTNKDHENDYQRQVLSIGLNCSLLYKELLEFIQQIFQENINSETKKQDLVVMSKNISSSVSNILQIAEILKGTDWCDPENQTFIAENELLGAANSIETAAKKLSVLQPRKKITQVNYKFIYIYISFYIIKFH